MDILVGLILIILGNTCIISVQYAKYFNDSEEHHLSESTILGKVDRVLGDSRIRYRDSAVWHDLTTYSEDFEKGDAVFTSHSGFVDVKFQSKQTCQIFPNSLVILNVFSKSRGLEEPFLEAKQGKIKLIVKPGESSARLKVGNKEYEFKPSTGKDAEVEVTLNTDSNEKSPDIQTTAPVEVQSFEGGDSSHSKPGTEQKKFNVNPKIDATPQPTPKIEKPALVDKEKEVKAKASEIPLTPKMELDQEKLKKTEKTDAKSFIDEASQVKEKEKPQLSAEEAKVLKELELKLKKAGFKTSF